MDRRKLWAGIALLALGVATADAAPKHRTYRAGVRSSRVVKAKPAARRAVPVRVVSRQAAVRPATRVKRWAPATRTRSRTLWAQAAAGDGASMAPGASTQEPAMIAREAEPLMIRVLSAYYVTDERAIRELRARGWSFGDVATAGNVAARSRRPLYEVARMYEDRRDWTRVAQDLSVPSDDLYAAVNAPRYAMIRPTPEEESQMMANRMMAQGTVPTLPPGTPEGATAQPGAVTNGAAQPGAVTNGAAQPGALTTQPGATEVPATPGAQAAAPPYGAPMMTPVERVASARLELMPREPNALLRHATATYYALPPSAVRELSARGWSMSDILVAGNLDNRSEATFEEVVALRDSGLEWSAVADRIGIAPDSLYQPMIARRVTTIAYPTPYWERNGDRDRNGERYRNGDRDGDRARERNEDRDR